MANTETTSTTIDLLWQQLHDVNLSITRIHKEVHASKVKQVQLWSALFELSDEDRRGLEPAINAVTKPLHLGLSEAQIRFEDLRDSLRSRINVQIRPTIRHLRILDLPDELLLKVFDYVRGDTGDSEMYFSDFLAGDIKQIQKIRLTCRRFCDTSSHLLLRHVKVHLSEQSLTHLDEVSRHISIRQGIRAVYIILDFYSPVLSKHIQAFAQYNASRLQSSVDTWDEIVSGRLDFDAESMRRFENTIAKARPILDSWNYMASNRSAKGDDREGAKLLRTAHDQYQQLQKAQSVLHDGGFVRAVANALTRIPTARWMIFQDSDMASQSLWRMAGIGPDVIDDYGLLQDHLLQPILWETARSHDLGVPHAEIIHELLITCHQSQVLLEGLDIQTPLPQDLFCLLPSNGDSRLHAGIGRLTAVNFDPREMKYDGFWPGRTATEWEHFLPFLSWCLDSASLKYINLDLGFMWAEGLPPVATAGPVLMSRTWPALTHLSFHGAFRFEELETVLISSERKLTLQWSGYLVSGTWAEVLDLMKGRVSERSTIGTTNGQPEGAECEGMSRRVFQFIFQRESKVTWGESRATYYIRGWDDMNPIWAWESEDLDMLEEDLEVEQ